MAGNGGGGVNACRPVCTGGWHGLEVKPPERPATMLQPVTFDDSPGEARTVRMVPVDESGDDW